MDSKQLFRKNPFRVTEEIDLKTELFYEKDKMVESDTLGKAVDILIYEPTKIDSAKSAEEYEFGVNLEREGDLIGAGDKYRSAVKADLTHIKAWRGLFRVNHIGTSGIESKLAKD